MSLTYTSHSPTTTTVQNPATTYRTFRCPHGSSPMDTRYSGTWFAPFDKCLCCGIQYPYVDTSSWSTAGSTSRTWTRGLCLQCGGSYINYVSPPLVCTCPPIWYGVVPPPCALHRIPMPFPTITYTTRFTNTTAGRTP